MRQQLHDNRSNWECHVVVTFDLQTLTSTAAASQDMRPPEDKIHRFRVLASRYSLALIYIWSGVMLAGLGLFYYKHKTGAKVHCKLIEGKYKLTRWVIGVSPHEFDVIDRMVTVTSEDMQPNEEVSRKMVNWLEKLGLDQVRRIMQHNLFLLKHAYCPH